MVAGRLLSRRVEKQTTIGRFSCSPVVLSRGPDVVKYDCSFNNMYTNTHIQLNFKVTYNTD